MSPLWIRWPLLTCTGYKQRHVRERTVGEWKRGKVENNEGVHLTRHHVLKHRTAPWLPAKPLTARLGPVWLMANSHLGFCLSLDDAGQAVSLFYANPCIWEGMGGGGECDEQSGHVAPGGQAEWWKQRARVWLSLPGERESWLAGAGQSPPATKTQVSPSEPQTPLSEWKNR